MKSPPKRHALVEQLAGLAAIVVLALAVAGCDMGPKSAVGFRLPDGNAAKGRTAFIELKCYACHRVADADVPAPLIATKPPVLLGGEVSRIRTYGDLVTSIINPSHRLSARMGHEWDRADHKSPMLVMNADMTVEQLIDLVAFIQPHYRQIPPSFHDYR